MLDLISICKHHFISHAMTENSVWFLLERIQQRKAGMSKPASSLHSATRICVQYTMGEHNHSWNLLYSSSPPSVMWLSPLALKDLLIRAFIYCSFRTRSLRYRLQISCTCARMRRVNLYSHLLAGCLSFGVKIMKIYDHVLQIQHVAEILPVKILLVR